MSLKYQNQRSNLQNKYCRSKLAKLIQFLLKSSSRTSIQKLQKFLKLPISDIQEVLHFLSSNRIGIKLINDKVEVFDKFELLKFCIENGISIDLEKIGNYIPWQDFEKLVKYIFEKYQFKTFLRMRFYIQKKLVEIDLICIKENKPEIYLVEIKKWKRNVGLISKIQEFHTKCEIICKNVEQILKKLNLGLNNVKIIPIVVSLHTGKVLFWNGIPIISIMYLRDFLENLDAILPSLRIFECKVHSLF